MASRAVILIVGLAGTIQGSLHPKLKPLDTGRENSNALLSFDVGVLVLTALQKQV